MLICKSLDGLAALGKPLHLALGVFDGVHAGHQAVIERAVKAAATHGGLAGLLTFDPHPIRVIAPEKAPTSLLATLEHKAQIVRDLGVELFIPLKFDAVFAAMEASAFIERLAAASVRTIAVGEDWRFGHHRSGDAAMLRQAAEIYDFKLEAVPPVMFDGDRISSTRIRQAIRDGNLESAHRMLGRSYSVSGTVVQGEKLGRTLGFPTANIQTGDAQLPPNGVWAVRAMTEDGKTWDGVANLGARPTIGGNKRLLEAHLFGFSGELYGMELEIRFEKFLRSEIKFPSLEELRNQIEKDADAARDFLAVPQA
ncbi:MAG: bifunctional riboflavin kinase/FAD synthetase [Gloeobacteraceae cyanobacterium ES-bin-144]|nr:bifunctional riboflavin kinase/FAD synthetase [Verrucomicrobiales bacterium]